MAAFDPRAVRVRCEPGRGLEGLNIHRPCAGAQPPEEAGGSSPRVGGNPEGLGCRWRECCCAALRPETRLAKRAVDLTAQLTAGTGASGAEDGLGRQPGGGYTVRGL